MKDRLKALRKALGLKQRELAERLECGASLVGKWEAGQQAVPVYRIYQICKEFNVRREWLENGDGEMFEPEEAPEAKNAREREAIFAGLYDGLRPEFKEAFKSFAREKLGAKFPEESDKPQPAKGPRVQTNNGTVHGDMVQN